MPILDSTAYGKLIALDTGVTTARLPSAASVAFGQVVTLVNRTTNTIAVSPAAGDSINQYGQVVATVTLSAGSTLEFAVIAANTWTVSLTARNSLPVATNTMVGGVKVLNSTTNGLQVAADGSLTLQNASNSQQGGLMLGNGLYVDANQRVNARFYGGGITYISSAPPSTGTALLINSVNLIFKNVAGTWRLNLPSIIASSPTGFEGDAVTVRLLNGGTITVNVFPTGSDTMYNLNSTATIASYSLTAGITATFIPIGYNLWQVTQG